MSCAHWLSHEKEKHTLRQYNVAADHKNGRKPTANPEGTEGHQLSLSDIPLLYLLLSVYKLRKQKKKNTQGQMEEGEEKYTPG